MWDYNREENGFGLIEVMLSFTILTIILLGILLLQGKLMHSKVVVERKDEVMDLANEKLEDVLIRYPYGSITTTGTETINTPPLFNTITTRNKIQYFAECTVTDLDDPFDNFGSETGTPADDYKEIKVTVRYPIRGNTLEGEIGTQTVVRYLYKTER